MNLKFWQKKEDQPKPAARKYVPTGLLQRLFTAAGTDRLNADWGATPLPADAIIRQHQRILVARSREQAANNDYAKAFLRMCSQNIVGPKGVTLHAQARDKNRKLDSAANEAIEREFERWGHRQHCDITGQNSWRGIQRLVIQTAAKDGEYFVRKIFGRAAGKYGLALQVLDPQRCPPDLDRNDLANGRYVRAGIEFSEFGKPVAYYFEITATGKELDFYHFNGRDYQRIPAEEILHGFLPEMVGQKRGLPWMATGLFRLRQLKGFEDAAIVNARIGAAKMGFIQYENGFGPEMEDDEAIEIDAEAGTFHELPAGASLAKFDPQYPSGEFATQVKAMLRGVAAGFGVPYNELAQDLEGVNFSSIRSGTLDSREHWKDLQEWFIESFHQPIFEEWLPRALLAGHIKFEDGRALPASKLDKFSAVEWQARRWDWIDPRADVDAAVASKNSLLRSPGSIIRDSGKDPHAIYREIAADIEEMRAAGIPEDFIKLAMGQQLAAPAQNGEPKE